MSWPLAALLIVGGLVCAWFTVLFIATYGRDYRDHGRWWLP